MDLKERVKRLEARRGETSDEWMSKFYKDSGGDANDEIVKLADLLADATPSLTSEVIDLVGGLEHYRPYESMGDTPFFFTGMENISDTVVRIFDRIIAFIKKWIKVFADAEFKLSLHTALHSHSLENIRTNMRTQARKTSTHPTFVVNTRIQNISVNHRPMVNAIGLINALTVLRAVTENYFVKHSEQVLGQVRKVIENVAGQSKAEHLAELMLSVSPVKIGASSIMTLNKGYYITPHLLGNHRFMITDDSNGSSDPIAQVQAIRVKLVPSQDAPIESPSFINFEHFDNNMTEAVLTKCDTILSLLSKSNNGPGRHARRQALGALLAAVEKVNADVQRNGLRSEDEARNVICVLESYIAWIADPYTTFYSYVLRNVRAALNVCEANIA